MPDVGRQLVDTGVNMGVSRGLGAIGVRSPVPLPDFYNSASSTPFRDSQAVQMLRGNRRAWRGYGRRTAAGIVDGLLMATPVGAINQGVKFVSGLFGHPWSIGRAVTNAVADRLPTGHVSVGNINTTGDGPESYAYTDQSTGQVSYGSPYGPWASGYQGLPGAGPTLPNWDVDYSTGDEPPDYVGPYSPEVYGLKGPTMPSTSFTLGGRNFGTGVWQGGGGTRSFRVSTGSLSPSNYTSPVGGSVAGAGVIRKPGSDNGESQN